MNPLTIRMLDAKEGDCFLIEAGAPEAFRILVDCGPGSAWEENIYPALKGRSIDLLILTHLDSDHIGGALKLFPDDKRPVIPVKEVWFNGLRHLIPGDEAASEPDEKTFLDRAIPYIAAGDGTKEISFAQSDSLSIRLRGFQEIWNTRFGHDAVKSSHKPIDIADGLKITVITPTSENLEQLLRAYERELRKRKISAAVRNSPEMQEAFERYFAHYSVPLIETNEISYSSARSIEELTSVANITLDRSVVNASSIGFIMEAQGKCVLFLGDIPSQHSIPALLEWKARTGNPLRFDAVKLPHHGSKQNCMELLDYIEAPVYFVPTDGSKHGHPSKETLAKIIARPTAEVKRILFSHEHEAYHFFNHEDLKEKYRYGIQVQGLIQLTEES